MTADPFGLSGQVLDGQFRVDAMIGEGGFSVVYKGHHLGLNEPIAIKFLKLPSALGTALVESFIHRFRDESRLLYRLSQGNLHILRSMASGTAASPITGALIPYMVLEWLEGRSVADDFTARRAASEGGRPLDEVLTLFGTAADALAYAHAQGVVHRDLNPGNLFYAKTPGGTRMKVLDFGVAKIMADSQLELGARAATLGAIRIFAPAYGAPEQFDDRVGPIGTWTDVYGFTLVLLESLTGATVNDAEHIGEFALLARDEARRPTPRALGLAVSDAVEAVFAKALSVDPRKRYPNVGELWDALTKAAKADAAPVTSGGGALSRTAVMDPAAHAQAVAIATRPAAAAAEDAPKTQRLASALLQTMAMADRPGVSHAPAEASQKTQPTFAPLGAREGSFVGPPPATPREPSFAGPPPREGSFVGPPPREASYVGPPPMTPRDPSWARQSALPPSALPGSEPHGPPPRPSIEARASLVHDPTPPAIPRSRGPLVVAAVIGIVLAILLVVGVVLLATRGRGATSTKGGATSAPSVSVSTTSASSASASSASASSEVAPPLFDPTPADAAPDAALEAAAPAAKEPDDDPPRLADPAPAPPSASVAPPPLDPNAFDEGAARDALRRANGVLAFCKRGGLSGPGSASVTFAPSGAVTSVVLAPPYAGTKEGACVQGQLERASTKRFVGAPQTVTHAFAVPK